MGKKDIKLFLIVDHDPKLKRPLEKPPENSRPGIHFYQVAGYKIQYTKLVAFL